ncbi:MAG: chromosome segregation protein SMC [Peptostreptococcus porci]|uniref:AAA family ATPase n=1 Tax=Peptostreptococcus porci TaxID=2652282 RepID=UPI002A7595D8|nr:chromosome segregation protein SMC [Peptostreptococcus porci]MDY2793990.1 chromosome segregation protein SMC [Peptostreptococcus porci]MDY5480206.1 chromosome segregation protein SMC [Peptostreptococcus porci]
MEQIKINKLEIENVKRVKVVQLKPSENGLTIIGGNNNQGKTSVLDSIAWALGGNRYKPSNATREGSIIPPNLKITMSNGLIVERKGKNSDLKVIDPNGEKAGQQLLDSFVEELALNLPKFMNQTNKEKANTLLQIIGVGDKLFELEQKETEIYNKRHAIGQIKDQKEKFAKEQTYYPDAPQTLISASDLIKKQQNILAKNGENQRQRDNLRTLVIEQESDQEAFKNIEEKIYELEAKKKEVMSRLNDRAEKILNAKKTVEELNDESTAELEASIENIEKINEKVRANLYKEKAEEDAKKYKEQYDSLTSELSDVRKKKTELLINANLPLSGLMVEDGELLYNGFKWDNMSGADQLKVSTAIVRKLNPSCGFVLMDKLEQMDLDTLKDFGAWLESEGLQVIATRVSKGDECSIIIEDGYVLDKDSNNVIDEPKWKAGEF